MIHLKTFLRHDNETGQKSKNPLALLRQKLTTKCLENESYIVSRFK